MNDDFFGPAIPGLFLIEDLVDEAAQLSLITEIEETSLAPFRFQQWTGRRETASYGLHYDFTASTLSEAEAFPPWLDKLARMVEAKCELPGRSIVHALLTRYPVGAAIGWHRDRAIFGEVFGISLGTEAFLRLRRRQPAGFSRYSLPLRPGSLYRLSGEARTQWEHSIAPLQQLRWSITLRTLA
ncbi:hypothetical protein CA262_06605 [Sphingobium sp. GW456-12-10-14-TSB1]|uniref:alpha-ketoglutarate-dependent dioxygenase AlkB n=1 Tax=Alphaproteobacteria TaxID=28211 RepID=UPI00055C9E1C|nr:MULTISPECIES: alpha-ketoglutarate-dependent dioxygenase AlkB [Alphaproteobacteria]OUC54568.1 hypothetical protein CA262_06605 [Sphingobium sp. GW456-12-10-14-TSB1]TAJ29305.1 MAG: alpha-ketoglutarate-dependent dioxygenase AlkB [Bosea sp. (in: a-proteobacteria)]SMC30397.1 Alkylated DNA repair dioxygenase AlkB [Novosphingobium sp. B1]